MFLVGVAEGQEAGVHIHLEVATSTDMSLPVALVLLDLPAELVLKLDVQRNIGTNTETLLQGIHY